jgi:UDP-N-acetyl-D-glucosamine dehydrogenase
MSRSDPETVAVVGQGYVGLPLSIALINSGFKVIGFDIDRDKISNLLRGISQINDISNYDLKLILDTERYFPTFNPEEIEAASVVIICVPTPLNSDSLPDLDPIRTAVITVAPFVQDNSLFILESTSYPGTLRNIVIPIFNSMKTRNISNIFFAVAPERVNPGDLLWNQKNTTRVIGGINEDSLQKAKQFYSQICDSVFAVSSPEIAEASKLIENTFRLVNISLVNELASLCQKAGLDISEVLDAASSKPYGFMKFNPGIGVGGHCIPIDPAYLNWWAKTFGVNLQLVEKSFIINNDIPQLIIKRISSMLRKDLEESKILIIGISYKSNVADFRESPALKILNGLRMEGAKVAWHDDNIAEWFGEKSVPIDWECDLVVITVEQPGVDYSAILEKQIPVLDCVNALGNTDGVTSLY